VSAPVKASRYAGNAYRLTRFPMKA